jgi:hypothetical protein
MVGFSGYEARKTHDGAPVKLGVGSEPPSNNLGGTYILGMKASLSLQMEKNVFLDNRHYMPSLKLIRPQQSGSQLLQHIRTHRSVPDEKRITCKIGKLNRKSFS